MLGNIMESPITWYVMFGVILVSIIGILVVNFPKFKIVFFTILCVILAGTAIYSGAELNTYYNAEGGIRGYIEALIQQNEAEKIDSLKYSINNISFSPTVKENEYTATIFINEVLSLEENTNYGLYVNGIPCSNIEFSPDHIKADFSYSFYDYEDNILAYDTLTFRVAMYETYTTIYVKTDGGYSAVKCWYKYAEKNGFTFEIKPFEYVEQV